MSGALALATRLDLLRRVELLRPGTLQRPPRGPSADKIRRLSGSPRNG
jgi:hypothetical protein